MGSFPLRFFKLLGSQKMADETVEGAIPVCDSSDIMHMFIPGLCLNTGSQWKLYKVKIGFPSKKLLNRLFAHCEPAA